MSRTHQLILKILFDSSVLMLSMISAFYLRFHSGIFLSVYEPIGLFHDYLITFLIFIPFFILITSFFEIYDATIIFSITDIFYNRFKSCSLAMLFFFTTTFFYRSMSYSRVTLILVWLILIIFSFCEHLGWLKLFPPANALFILNVKDYEQYKDSLLGAIRSNLLVFNDIPSISKIIEMVKTQQIRNIFIIMEDYTRDQIIQLSNRLIYYHCRLNLVPSMMFVYPVRFDQYHFKHLDVLGIELRILKPSNRFIKRIIDLSVSFVMLLIFLPIILMIILVLMMNGGPIIYTQIRTGRIGKEFKLYKFCTMIANAESNTGPVWAVEHDHRVTFWGRILRNSSLDELPQLWNIFKGDMSLIGPRPERPFFVEQFTRQWPEYTYRHLVKPGLTGWAQVNGLRGQSSIKERLNYDLYYIYSFSWYLEIKILFRTMMEFLFHKKAY